MRGRVLWGAAAWLIGGALPAAAGPPPDVPPTISFPVASLTISEGPSEPCSDALGAGGRNVMLVVDDADGAPTGAPPVEVGHVESGDAVVGVDYEALPAPFSPVEPVVLQAAEGPDPAGSTATLVITLQPHDGYVVGEPSTLTVTIVHTDERCDRPTFAAVPTNSAQTIAVGQVPVPLQLVDPVNGEAFAALISGQLPPGVGLARDGSFTGAATTAGTFVATVGSCRPVFGPPPGHCSSTALTVRVTGTSVADRVPPCSVRATGATSSAGEPFVFDAVGATLAFLGDLPGAPGAALVHRVATGSTDALPNLVGAASPVTAMTAIDISRDGRTVVYAMPWVAVGDGHETAVGAYDVASGEARVAFRVAGFTSDVLLAPDGRHAYALVLQSSGGSSIVVADVTTGAVHHLSTGFGDLVDVSDDGAWLLVNRVDRTVVVDVATGAVVDVPLDAGQAPLGFGTTSSTIVLLEHDEEPVVPALLDLATSATRPLPTVDGVRAAAVSRGGRALALGATADIEGRNPDGSDELHLQPLSGSRIQVTEVAGTRAVGLLPTAVDDLGRTAAFVAAGTLDLAGRGTVADSVASTVHVARCAGSVLARTG